MTFSSTEFQNIKQFYNIDEDIELCFEPIIDITLSRIDLYRKEDKYQEFVVRKGLIGSQLIDSSQRKIIFRSNELPKDVKTEYRFRFIYLSDGLQEDSYDMLCRSHTFRFFKSNDRNKCLDQSICNICFSPFIDPILTSCCRQKYCRYCIHKWLELCYYGLEHNFSYENPYEEKSDHVLDQLLDLMKLDCILSKTQSLDHFGNCFSNPNTKCKSCGLTRNGTDIWCLKYRRWEDIGGTYDQPFNEPQIIDFNKQYLRSEGYELLKPIVIGRDNEWDNQVWEISKFEGKHLPIKVIYACKVVSLRYHKNRSAIFENTFPQFLKESEILMGLKHLNVIKMQTRIAIPIQESGFPFNYICIVMERMDGSLQDLLNDRISRRMSAIECREWFTQIASAVDYLHNRITGGSRIAHLAIRAMNILWKSSFMSSKIYKLIDFEDCKQFGPNVSVEHSFSTLNSDIQQLGNTLATSLFGRTFFYWNQLSNESSLEASLAPEESLIFYSLPIVVRKMLEKMTNWGLNQCPTALEVLNVCFLDWPV